MDTGHLNPDKIYLLGKQHHILQKHQQMLLNFKQEMLNEQYYYNIQQCLDQEQKRIQVKFNGIEGALDALYHISLSVEPLIVSTSNSNSMSSTNESLNQKKTEIE